MLVVLSLGVAFDDTNGTGEQRQSASWLQNQRV
jgi:hypothetical protein